MRRVAQVDSSSKAVIDEEKDFEQSYQKQLQQQTKTIEDLRALHEKERIKGQEAMKNGQKKLAKEHLLAMDSIMLQINNLEILSTNLAATRTNLMVDKMKVSTSDVLLKAARVQQGLKDKVDPALVGDLSDLMQSNHAALKHSTRLISATANISTRRNMDDLEEDKESEGLDNSVINDTDLLRLLETPKNDKKKVDVESNSNQQREKEEDLQPWEKRLYAK